MNSATTKWSRQQRHIGIRLKERNNVYLSKGDKYMNKKISNSRIFWLDVARCVAIISITLNHAVNRAYHVYEGQSAEFFSIPLGSTLFKTVVYVFSRIGVPLFLMISGALLFNKEINNAEDIKKFYKHNLLSLLITSEIWMFIMYWVIYIME